MIVSEKKSMDLRRERRRLLKVCEALEAQKYEKEQRSGRYAEARVV